MDFTLNILNNDREKAIKSFLGITMQCDIRVTNLFRKRIKKLEKKYPNVKSDVLSVVALIDKTPEAGDRLQG